jgi:hypothetical protein
MRAIFPLVEKLIDVFSISKAVRTLLLRICLHIAIQTAKVLISVAVICLK